MAKRTRVTTSVSTIVKQIAQLKLIAKVAGRKDLSKEFAEISIRVTALELEYNKLVLEMAPFVKLMLTDIPDDEEDSE